MSAKEYLMQIRKMNVLISKKQEELAHLKYLTESITARYDGEKVSSSGNHDKMADTICKIVDLENEINEDIQRMIEVKQEIINTIDKLIDPEMIDLLYRRYLRFEKWEKIAYKMNYSLRGVHKLHGRALIEIEKSVHSSARSMGV